MTECPECDFPLDLHNLDLRYELPDLLLEALDKDPDVDIRTSAGDPASSDMLYAPAFGRFLRALFKVQLRGDCSLTHSVWVEVSEETLDHVDAVWDDDEHADLVVEGHLANQVHPGGQLGAQVTLKALDPNEIPYVVASTDPGTQSALSDIWEHAPVLGSLPV